jgi:hypothetical protein
MMVDWITEYHPKLTVLKFSFAWQLKEVCHTLYGWMGLEGPEFYEMPENEHLRSVKIQPINLNPVEIWIALSKAIREDVYDRTFLDMFKHTVKADILIVPDFRFPMEEEVFDYKIKVNNSRVPPKNTPPDRALDGYTGWNYQINNESDLGDLRRQTITILREILDVQSQRNDSSQLKSALCY